MFLCAVAVMLMGCGNSEVKVSHGRSDSQVEEKEEASSCEKPEMGSMKDQEGNEYQTVKIGKQEWMAENLRTTHYADGTQIKQGTKLGETSCTTGYWYYPNSDTSNKSTYGLLYNWKAVMRNSLSSSANPSGVQGICPTGWHVPSDADWMQLIDYVGTQSQYRCGDDKDHIAKALSSKTKWSYSSNQCAVGNSSSDNNATGFSALPAGYYYGCCGEFRDKACFWTATENEDSNAYSRQLLYHMVDVHRRDFYNKSYGFSVRCVRD